VSERKEIVMKLEGSPYDAAIADVEVRISALQVTLDTLKDLRAQSGGSVPTGSTGDIPHDAFFQMTVVDAAEKYLRLAKKTKPNPELADALLKGGLKSTSQNFSEMVRSVLFRDSRFVRVNSEWGLSEWYPGMRKARAGTPETPPEPKAPNQPPTKAAAQKKTGFSPDSLKGRTLGLLDSNATETFDSPKIAGRLNAEAPSVSAALASLYADGLILRPKRSQYKSKHLV
jgi:hypothetical protein